MSKCKLLKINTIHLNVVNVNGDKNEIGSIIQEQNKCQSCEAMSLMPEVFNVLKKLAEKVDELSQQHK